MFPRSTGRLRIATISAGIAVMMVVTACSSPQDEQVTREAAGLGATIPSLPTKAPENVFGLYNQLLDGSAFATGILSCLSAAGCFGDSKADATRAALKNISGELDGIKADIASGIATTRLDVAESNYALVEQAYNRKFGTHIATAYRALLTMSDAASSTAQRSRAFKNFKVEAEAVMPATAETAMQTYLGTVGGTGQALTQAGLLGATWRLITAQIRQEQGDANGSVPVYMPASAINLMANMGTQRLIEGAQLAAILTAYSVTLYPEDYANNTRAQDELQREITSLWINGYEGTPGAASIAASLPRTVPAQSGVFSDLGTDGSAGLLVRNFGPVVDPSGRPGPLVNADAGYVLSPGLDDWLWVTRFRNDARRELTLGRSGPEWSYDQATGSLTMTIARTAIPDLSDEAGSVVAVHPATLAAGEIVRFTRAGTAPEGTSGWIFDANAARISPNGRPDLCMALGARVSPWQRDFQIPKEWIKGVTAQGWRFSYDKIAWLDDRTPSIANAGMIALPRITLQPCAPDSMQQWYVDGPVPQDRLPFWDVNALMSVSPTNAEAVDKDAYPLNFWRVLKNQDVKNLFSVIASRGLDDATLFERYGSVRTPPVDRALPPALHPLMFATARAPYWFDVPTDRGGGQDTYPVLGVAWPVTDGATKGFSVRPVRVSSVEVSRTFVAATSVPWLSTAAMLGLDVDPCTFTFVPPARATFACEYKNRVKDEVAVPQLPLTAKSRARATTPDAVVPSASTSTPDDAPSDTPSPLQPDASNESSASDEG